LSILFTELPLLERPAAAAEAGFTAVEFWWPFDRAVPDGGDVDRFAAAVEDAGVQVANRPRNSLKKRGDALNRNTVRNPRPRAAVLAGAAAHPRRRDRRR
jgi:sugar phosphate isomerase/epimerase